MKKIYIYPDGSVAVLDDTSSDVVSISSQQPSEILEYTQENMDIYFPNLEKKSEIKVK